MPTSRVTPDYVAVSGESLVASPRDNGSSDIPDFGHIVLDNHLLTLVKDVRLLLFGCGRDLFVSGQCSCSF